MPTTVHMKMPQVPCRGASSEKGIGVIGASLFTNTAVAKGTHAVLTALAQSAAARNEAARRDVHQHMNVKALPFRPPHHRL